MKLWRFGVGALTAAVFALPVACSDSGSTNPSPINSSSNTQGTVVVRLTDAPFSTDSIKRVDIFVVRVDARVSDADSSTADHALSSDSSSSNGWSAIASPNASFELLSLQNGITANLGESTLGPGTYSGFRFIIDPTQSSVTLKNGIRLTGTSSPSVMFPSAARSGIKVVLARPVSVIAGTTTTLLIDFDVNNSFVQRGNTIEKNGLIFKPVIKATVTNTATTNATVRLINATNSALDFRSAGTPLSGASNIGFGLASSCASVPVSTAALTITNAGSATGLLGFAPVLAVGSSTTFVAYPSASGGVQFATLGNAFAPTSGQAGLRVFNATSTATGYDVFVTALGAVLGLPTTSNVLAGAASAFTNVPAGAEQIRLTSAGGTTVVVDLGSQALAAGQNYTLVIAPPAVGTTIPRAFLVAGC
jgi:hypothetical protein